MGSIRQTRQQRLIGEVNDRTPAAGHQPAGDVIHAEDRGREGQLSGLTADVQRRAGREAQPVQPLRFDPQPGHGAIASQRLPGQEVHR
jgi:hypothetical protein